MLHPPRNDAVVNAEVWTYRLGQSNHHHEYFQQRQCSSPIKSQCNYLYTTSHRLQQSGSKFSLKKYHFNRRRTKNFQGGRLGHCCCSHAVGLRYCCLESCLIKTLLPHRLDVAGINLPYRTLCSFYLHSRHNGFLISITSEFEDVAFEWSISSSSS